MKRTNGGAQWWSEDKSFYLALMLCLAAIAVAAYLLFAFPNGTSDDDTMQAQEYQADDSVTASEALERIPAMDPQPAPEQQEIPGAVWHMGGFQRIPTMPAFDFSGQPSVLRFPSLLEGGICHKFFPAFQPCVRGNECFMGSDNKYLVF